MKFTKQECPKKSGYLSVQVIATSRTGESAALLRSLGAAAVVREHGDTHVEVRNAFPHGVDAVLDIVGNSTLLSSLKAARHYGKVCVAGFLGGLETIQAFDPLSQMPTGVQLSFFASFMLGSEGFPLGAIPFQEIVMGAEQGEFQAKPVKVFRFEDIASAHRLIESNTPGGKLVVTLT